MAEKGFKAAKITNKLLEERNILKKQIICCSPAGACADVIKNYAFTRVIVEGAQRIPQAITTLAFDKGYKKIFLIGDPKLPAGLVLSKFANNRNMSKSLFSSLI